MSAVNLRANRKTTKNQRMLNVSLENDVATFEFLNIFLNFSGFSTVFSSSSIYRIKQIIVFFSFSFN